MITPVTTIVMGRDNVTKKGFMFILTQLGALREVKAQAILFLKSMSERVGSDLEGLLNSMTWSSFNFELIKNFQSRSMSDPTIADIDFKNKMASVRATLNLE